MVPDRLLYECHKHRAMKTSARTRQKHVIAEVPTFFDEAGHRVATQYLFAVLHGQIAVERQMAWQMHDTSSEDTLWVCPFAVLPETVSKQANYYGRPTI